MGDIPKGQLENKNQYPPKHLSQNVTFSHLLFGRVSQGGKITPSLKEGRLGWVISRKGKLKYS